MTGSADDKRDFFVSFNQADRAWATWIAWVLEEAGYSVFFQDWDFRGSFIEQMHQASLRAGRTLVVLSDNYLRSEYARSEAWVALARDPVGREDRAVTVKVGPTGDLGLFSHFAYLDLTDSAEADAERLLLERVRKSLDPTYRPKPSTRPHFPGRSVPKPPFPAPAAGPALAVHNLPPNNPDFVGREQPLEELRRLLTSGQGPAVLTQAITGLGGIGKTQTALAYCYRHLTDYRLIWWLRAESPATLAADFATLAEPLGLDPTAADQEKLTTAIRTTLPDHTPCLLVFDNVEDPALPRAYLPRTGGHALITSRRTDWSGIAKALPLEVMPEAEALQLLTGRPDPEALPAPDLAEAKVLARELGYLPLALAQAQAYMREAVESVAGYRALLATSRSEMLREGRAHPDYPEPVAGTWGISIRAAEQQCPAARPLLELLAFLAPEALPRAVLDAKPEALPESLCDKLARNRAISALVRFSLIGTQDGSIVVHRLVQAVTRDRLDEATAKAWAEAAVQLVHAALPDPPQEHTNWPAMGMLLPHALAAAEAAERLGAGLETAATVLNQTALYYHVRATWAEAEPLYERALAIDEKTLGPEHPELASQLNNLALLYRTTGRHAEAEPLYARALAISEKTLGPEHPDLATWLNNLALLYRDTGRHAEAKPLVKRAIAIVEKTFGPKHPDLATMLNNLALLYWDTGRYAEAEPLHERALSITEKALGPEHPAFAIRLNNLAGLYQDTGRYAEAEPLYQRALMIIEKALPAVHPNQASFRENYARLLDRLGRGEEATALRAQAAPPGPREPGGPK
jgi:tetratricopeptide (TPR) repeat protein